MPNAFYQSKFYNADGCWQNESKYCIKFFLNYSIFRAVSKVLISDGFTIISFKKLWNRKEKFKRSTQKILKSSKNSPYFSEKLNKNRQYLQLNQINLCSTTFPSITSDKNFNLRSVLLVFRSEI